MDRLAEDGTRTISQEIDESLSKVLHRVEVRDKQGNCSEATVEIRRRRIRVIPSIGKQKRHPDLTLTVTYAQERRTPKDRAVDRAASRSLYLYITKLARLGRYFARVDGHPAGNKVMWRGLWRPTDIMLGFDAVKICG